jgi:manganese efflux pump family protein
MIGAVLVFGFLAGLDNLQVCSTLGLLPMNRARRHSLAAAFVLCETAAPLAGLLGGHAVLALAGSYARLAGPAMMICCGIAVLAWALRGEPENTAACGRMLFGLPVTLSLDNVVAGFGISSLDCPAWIAALAVGLTGAAMSCIGLYGAAQLRARIARWLPGGMEAAAGGWLIILAARTLIAGGV